MSDLTRNETLVLDALKAAQGPQSAYALLDTLREDGLRAPPQIYRALEKLVARGSVHRIETLNSFLACCDGDCQQGTASVFKICETCGGVDEINDPALGKRLKSIAGDFELATSTVEMRGICEACRSN